MRPYNHFAMHPVSDNYGDVLLQHRIGVHILDTSLDLDSRGPTMRGLSL